ncbi:MAG TPA: DEAD/DEAH box helicase [Burkholderiaceae bacterium]|nr:DEAD/DEAH box helicase [Burkholderiaceae bacterium]
MNSGFKALGLSEALVRAVTELGYTDPTAVQQQAIPLVLAGRDLLAGAQTGTGKTAGFVLPILHRLALTPPAAGKSRHPVRALILTPTRELAAQVEESVRDYGKYKKSTVAVVFGGVSINNQISALRRGVDIVVATPGRLLDHAGQKTIDLSQVEILVLDEADRMLDMGFLPDMKRVFALLPKQRQTLLFSATFSDEIRTLAGSLLRDPAMVQVAVRNSTVEAVSQKVILVDRGRKSELLAHLVKDNQWYQVLVFTRTKHGANRLAEYLNKHGVTALAIHGNKSQNARTSALAQFESGELQALVATDIAARGLDIEQLPHVVNFDLPHVPEDYVHRIGRTGRAGATGEAISLVCADDKPLLADIERVIRRQVPSEIVAGFEPNPNERAEPIQRGRGAPQRAPQRQAPKREGNGQRLSGQAPARKAPARPPHAGRAAPPARAEPKNAPRPATARPTEPQRARAVPAAPAPRQDASSTVRTNIPGLLQPGHRRGR